MDANASNFNADANIQGYDQWGNLQCVYASCDDIPQDGCMMLMDLELSMMGLVLMHVHHMVEHHVFHVMMKQFSGQFKMVMVSLGFDSNTGQTFNVESYPNCRYASLTVNGEV